MENVSLSMQNKGSRDVRKNKFHSNTVGKREGKHECRGNETGERKNKAKAIL